ncbi:hypothetical protein LLG95_03415 [bacterium]|nr:hypothetical protein [bacterium]
MRKKSSNLSEARLVVEISETTIAAIVTKARIADAYMTWGEKMIINDVGKMLNISKSKAGKLVAGCRPRAKELDEGSEVIHARLEEIFFAILRWVHRCQYAQTNRMIIKGNQGYLLLLKQIALSNGFKEVVMKADY